MGLSNVLIFRCVCRISYMVTSRAFPGSSAGICLPCRKPRFKSWVRKIPWRRNRLPTPVFLGFPGGSDSKESACSAKDLHSIPGLGRSPGGGHGNPLQYPCLKNPVDRKAWWAAVHMVAKNRTRLSNFHFTSLLRTPLYSHELLRNPPKKLLTWYLPY